MDQVKAERSRSKVDLERLSYVGVVRYLGGNLQAARVES